MNGTLSRLAGSGQLARTESGNSLGGKSWGRGNILEVGTAPSSPAPMVCISISAGVGSFGWSWKQLQYFLPSRQSPREDGGGLPGKAWGTREPTEPESLKVH